jgi:hypothetical protein
VAAIWFQIVATHGPLQTLFAAKKKKMLLATTYLEVISGHLKWPLFGITVELLAATK